jgi:hypothetical protein
MLTAGQSDALVSEASKQAAVPMLTVDIEKGSN